MAYLLVVISVTFTTLGQIFQKLAATRIKTRMAAGKPLYLAVITPHFFLGILTLGLGAFTWLLVLSRLELSLAYPLMSLGYVLVTLFSKYLFKETVPPHRWAGIATILFGIMLISRS
ncbi:EamA family transporter [Pseudodesulfovibrio sp. JC047]|uniref:EamA family transporter n=1 Tax=Pseudodesulfovibrio sp. JC047 TaxID=2683199 RepID=UPI0013D86AEA|nr:EamA family transporter [Pseudodesulfovibrio sp. JC047]NDV19268.1 EamA family transporter [Pseudodesulfovibrio sp. JC047]